MVLDTTGTALQKVVASGYFLKVLTNTNKSLSESYKVQTMPRDSPGIELS